MSKDVQRIVYALVALLAPPAFMFYVFQLALCFVPSIDPFTLGLGFAFSAVIGLTVAGMVLTESWP